MFPYFVVAFDAESKIIIESRSIGKCYFRCLSVKHDFVDQW